MPNKPKISNVLVATRTATNDLKFRLAEADVWIREGNLHIITNNALYGDTIAQLATAAAGDIVTFQDFNLADLYFRNAVAGNNTTIHFVGVKKEMH